MQANPQRTPKNTDFSRTRQNMHIFSVNPSLNQDADINNNKWKLPTYAVSVTGAGESGVC